MEKTASFADQILDVVNAVYEISKDEEMKGALATAFSSMLNDMSYIRGNKKEKLWEFNWDELKSLFEVEARILKDCGRNPAERPTRGILMTQLSNFILKSRNDYNQDYICKYLTENAAKSSIKNHEIWMRQTKDLKGAANQGRWRLPQRAFYNYSIQVLPFEEQIDIEKECVVLEKRIDEMIEALYKEISFLQELRTKIVADVVTGQIDVRDEIIPEYSNTEETEPDDELENEVYSEEESDDKVNMGGV